MEYRYINKETGLGGDNGTWGKKGRERYLPTHDYNPDDNREYGDGIYGAGGYRHCGRFCNLENKPSDFPIAPCYVKNAEGKVVEIIHYKWQKNKRGGKKAVFDYKENVGDDE